MILTRKEQTKRISAMFAMLKAHNISLVSYGRRGLEIFGVEPKKGREFGQVMEIGAQMMDEAGHKDHGDFIRSLVKETKS